MTKRKIELKLGNIYAIDWDDHFYVDRIMSDDTVADAPAKMRTIGKLVGLTPTHIKLESSCRTDMGSQYKSSLWGIMSACITKVRDFGPSRG